MKLMQIIIIIEMVKIMKIIILLMILIILISVVILVLPENFPQLFAANNACPCGIKPMEVMKNIARSNPFKLELFVYLNIKGLQT